MHNFLGHPFKLMVYFHNFVITISVSAIETTLKFLGQRVDNLL